ncbi:MAG TPA: iron ABC transporter permease [Symbiobacteriaceae bacterium]|nr:iron ABC transporter permease [Symbiobacteriaceae bacterium]
MMKVTSSRAFAKHCEHCAAPPRRVWWDVRVPNPGLLLAALLASLGIALPVLYLAVRAAQGGASTWEWLLSGRLPLLVGRTMLLAGATTLLAVALALPLAWLVSRTDLPGRTWLTWIAALPLVFPPYVGAFAFITLFGPRGSLEKVLARLWGVPGHQIELPSIYSLPGAVLVLALFTYPYLYLLLGSALRGGNQALEEAARSAGLSPARVFWRVTLPLLRPALAAGALLVALYALSDFGAVAMLRVETFTSAIYFQLRGRFDRSAAAALSTVLLVMTMLLLWLEERMQRQGARYYQTSSQWRPVRPVALGPWKWPATLFAWGVALVAVGLPVGMLGYWAVQGMQDGLFSADVLQYVGNSVVSAGGAALLATVLAFPVAYLAARFPGALSRGLFRFAYTGYALPGVVVALAVIFFFHTYVYPFYGTVWAMLAAYVIRFLPQSLGATHSGLQALSPSLEDAGRSLGLGAFGVLRRITLPLIAPSLITGGALVFLNTLKELPATLLLRPAGFDTLAVRVWIQADEGFYARAAPAALLLVLLAAIPMSLLLRRIFQGRARLS